MPDRFVLASLLGLLLTTSLPIVPAQAQVNLSCSQQFLEDLVRRLPYPNQPLPAIIATNSVSRAFAELNEIAQSPVSSNPIVQNYLDRWLIGRPFASRPDSLTPPQLDLVLKEISKPSERTQLIGILDKLAPRIEQLSDEQIKYQLIAGLARYYQRLGASDRATTILNRAIQASLKQSNARSRTSQLGGLLVTASELKQTPKIAGLLGQAETAIVATMQPGQNVPLLFQVTVPLTLAQSYFEANQPVKALQIVDRVTKFAPATQLNPDIARLYLQLKRQDKAQPYLNAILRSPSYLEDPRYLALAAVSSNPKLLNQIWEMIKNPSFDFDSSRALQVYFQAGGNPDRIAPLINSPDLRAAHSLTIAGEYRKRNQTQKSNQAIAQFVQAIQQRRSTINGAYPISIALRQGYVPEANTALRQLARLGLIPSSAYVVPIAQELKALDAIESTIQRFPNTDPEERIQVLQQFAVAYAQQNSNRAISLAQQLPLKGSYGTRSPRIEALTDIGVLQDPSMFALATKQAESLTDPSLKAVAYGAIARGYIKTGQEQAAETARQTAVKAAKAVPTNPNAGFTPNYVLSLLSQQFLNDSQIEPAWKTFQEIPKEAYKETNISTVVISATQVGQLDIAQQVAELIYQNQSPDSYLSVAPGLAQAYLSRNRTSEAIAILDRATTILNGKEARSPDAHIQVIRLLAQVGRIDTARQLLAKYPEPGEAGKLRRQELQSYIDCYAQRKSGLR